MRVGYTVHSRNGGDEEERNHPQREHRVGETTKVTKKEKRGNGTSYGIQSVYQLPRIWEHGMKNMV